METGNRHLIDYFLTPSATPAGCFSTVENIPTHKYERFLNPLLRPAPTSADPFPFSIAAPT